jgi:predicted RecB family nuclease
MAVPGRAEPCEQCNQCPCRDRFGDQWDGTDHLSLVANIPGSQEANLRAAGIDTVAALAVLPADQPVPEMAPDTLNKLRAQACVQVSAGNREHRLSSLAATQTRLLPDAELTDDNLNFDMKAIVFIPAA